MNRHTVVRAAGIGLALLAGAGTGTAPAWAAGPDGGLLSPAAGGGCAGRSGATAGGGAARAVADLLGPPVTGLLVRCGGDGRPRPPCAPA
ncbi:hypothetical protein ACSNOK_21120, partial [Streptomyces sp. URMC 126]